MATVPTEILGPLLQTLERSKPRGDRARLLAAFEFAANAHGSQLRLTGEPYVTHCVAVAVILAELLGPRADETILNFVNGAALARYGRAGVVTPDHVILTKPWPLIVAAPQDGREAEFKGAVGAAASAFL